MPAPALRRSIFFPCIGRDDAWKRFAFSIRYAAPAMHSFFIATFRLRPALRFRNIRAHNAGLHGLHECFGCELMHSVAGCASSLCATITV